MRRGKIIGLILSAMTVMILICTVSGASGLHGDFTGDGFIDREDAVHLLRHVYAPEDCPVNQSADMNGDGEVNSRDATYLMQHILEPDTYPIVITHTPGELVKTGSYCGDILMGHSDCTVCGETVYEIGHSLKHETAFGGCNADGSVRTYCLRCDYETVESIPAAGHTDGEWVTVTSPGCGSVGEAVRRCTFCDAVTATKEIPEAGHTFTSEVSGDICTYTCTDCGYTEEEDISGKYRLSFVTGTDVTVGDIYAAEGESVTLPVPATEGAVFGGWYTDIELTSPVGDSVTVFGDMTLYALWDAVTVTANDGGKIYETKAGVDHLFGVVCDTELSDGNIGEYISVTNSAGADTDIFVDRYEDGVYYIGGKYEEGDIYKAVAVGDITFCDSDTDELWFVIDGERQTEAVVKDEVVQVNDDLMLAAFEDDGEHYLILTRDVLDAGDTALVCGDEEGEFICAMDITAEEDFEGYRLYTYEPADPAKIFDDYNVFINESVDMSGVILSDELEEDLEEAILESAVYEVFSSASEAYALNRSAADSEYYFKFSDIKVEKPKFDILKEEEKGIKFTFKISCDFEQIDRRSGAKYNQFTIALNLESKLVVDIAADFSDIGLITGNFRVVLTTSANNSASLTISTTADIDDEKELDYFRMMMEEFEVKGQNPEIITAPAGKKKAIKLFTLPVSAYGFTFEFEVSNIFEFEITGQIGVGFTHHSVQQVTVDMNWWFPDIDTMKSSNMTLDAYFAGKMTVSEGLAFSVSFDFLKVAEIKVSFTASVYFELGGAISFSWNKDTGTNVSYGGYVEAGVKLEGNFFWRVFKFGNKKPIELFDPWKKAFFTFGQKKMPLHFTNQTEEHDFTLEFGEEIDLDEIINKNITYQDLITFAKSSSEADGFEYFPANYDYPMKLETDGSLKILPGRDLSPTIKIRVEKGNIHKIVTLNITIDHEHTLVSKKLQGSCTRDTVYEYRCTSCGCHYKETTMKAPGHSYGEWITVQEETCYLTGEYYRLCLVCESRDKRVEDALGHTFGEDHACIRCGLCDHGFTEQIPTEKYLYKKASCITYAVYRYACAYCGDGDPDTGHTFEYGDYAPHIYADPWTCHDRPCEYPGCDHVEVATTEHNLVEFDVEPGGCSTVGYTVYACWDCGETFTDLEDGIIHAHDYVVMDGVPATCTEDGVSKWIECVNCGMTHEKNEIPALGHDYDYVEIDGEYHEKFCTREGCGHTEGGISHGFGEWIYVRTASCTSEGYKYRLCESCGYMEDDVVPALGHNITEYDAKAATCTSDGHNAYEMCKRCDYTTIVIIPAYGHSYGEEWRYNSKNHYHACTNDGCSSTTDTASHDLLDGGIITPATCTDDGEKTVYCSVCDYETVVIIPATGHSYSTEWSYDGNSHYRACGNDGCSATTDTASHDLLEGGIITPATCTDDGEKTVYCSVCDYETVVIIPATGHSYSTEWSYDDDSHYRVCENDGCTAVTDKTAHTLKEETESATCTEEGVKRVYCTVCDYEITETIPATGHSYGEDWLFDDDSHYRVCANDGCTAVTDKTSHTLKEDTHSATCTEDGVKRVYCTVCEYEITDTIPATGHSYGGEWFFDDDSHYRVCANDGCTAVTDKTAHTLKEDTHSATCTEDGVKTVYCSVCDYETVVIIPATGHSYSTEWSYDDDSHYRVCTNDGCDSVTDKSAHSLAEETITPATCAEDGVNRVYCTVCDYETTETIPAPGHSITEYDAKDPTCTEDGHTAYESCSQCDYTTVGELLPALGHLGTQWHHSETDGIHTHHHVCERAGCGMSFDETSCVFESSTVPPTCTEGGYDEHTCTVCGFYYADGETLRLGHDYEEVEGQSATCTEDGWQPYLRCKRDGCDFTTYTVIPAFGHYWSTVYYYDSDGHFFKCMNDGCTETKNKTAHNLANGSIITPPTCTEKGTVAVSCTKCDFTGTRSAPALGHTTTGDATCTEDLNCSVCSEVVKEKLGHSYNAVVTPPTCEDDGFTTHSCKRCTYSYTDSYKDALGHAFAEEWTYDGDYHYHICERSGCDVKDGTAAHTYVNGEIDPAPTCTEDGSQPVLCSVCGRVSEYITHPALGHSYVKYLNTEEEDTGEEIIYYHTAGEKCTRCGDFVSKGTTVVHEHYGVEFIAPVLPTCTEIGYVDGFKCSVCGEILEAPTEVPATGHDFGSEWIYDEDSHWHICGNDGCTATSDDAAHDTTTETVIQSTCTVAGLAKVTCTVCDYFDTVNTGIGEHTFEDGACTNCGEADPDAYSQGLAYTLSDDGTYYIVSGIGSCTDTDVVIPAKYSGLPVKEIGSYAFLGCTSLTTITIPEGVTSIESGTFWGCTSLTDITIPEGVTSIGSYAFKDCTSLTTITIPESVTSIVIFTGCKSLTNIDVSENNVNYKSNDGVLFSKTGDTLIWYPAGKTNTEYIIPEGVTSIGSRAFYECTSLTTITIPEGVTGIGSGAFYGCTSLTDITIPEGVTSIGTGAFQKCTSLTDITIPEGVTSIEMGAFEDCTSLTDMTIPEGVTSIGDRAFQKCTSLTDITIPEGVTSIELCAFSGCTSLTDITIPSSVTYIGDYAFNNCTALSSITIPEGVTSIDSYAFANCTSLTSIYYGGTPAQWSGYNITDLPSASTVYYYSETTPDFTTGYSYWHYVNGEIVIWDPAEAGPQGLAYTLSDDGTYYIVSGIGDCEDTELVIPSQYSGLPVKEIGEKAFNECTLLTSVIIPEGVTTIGNGAFRWCTSLLSVEIPEGVTEIQSNTFYWCTSLTDVVIPEGIISIGEKAFFATSLTDVVIPDSVEIIGDYAFNGCSYITSLTLSEGLHTIGNESFRGCTSLTAITIPDSVTCIGENAFTECTGLKALTIGKGVQTVENKAFYNCSSLERINFNAVQMNDYSFGEESFVFHSAGVNGGGITVNIGNAVTRIPAYLFCDYYNDHPNISKVVFEAGSVCKSIGDFAFYGCGVTSVAIPGSVTTIGVYAFGWCGSLKAVTLGNGIETIDECAFEGCTALTSIVIPASVTYIGSWAFYDCTSLTSITIPSSVTYIGEDAFYGCPGNPL